jgi:glucokinase
MTEVTTVVNEDIEEPGMDFVNALQGGDFRSAESIFNDMLADKVQSSLDAEKIAVAGRIFNDEEELDGDDLDDDLEDDLDDETESDED